MADEIIIDEYQLLNHISTGSSTQVWEAADKGGGDRRYAMKVMLPEALAESERRSVLKHEAKLGERFEHVNFVRFHKLVLTKQRGYILMDYFRAPNLKTQLQTELVSVQARLPRLLEQLCQVLGYLHGLGWVHRDIKPENILFNKASELRLIDFSLTTRAAGAVAKMLGAKEKVIQGTRTYISPETILKAPITPQSDIYSLGVTLFEVLTGDPPFRGSSPDELLKKHLTGQVPEPSAFNPNVTPEMDRMILRLLSKKAAKRQRDTHEILAEFRNIKPFKEDVIDVDRRRKEAEAGALQDDARQSGTTRQSRGRGAAAVSQSQPGPRERTRSEKVPAKPSVASAGTSKACRPRQKLPRARPSSHLAARQVRPQRTPQQPDACVQPGTLRNPLAQQPARPQQAPQAPVSPQQMPNQPMHQQPMPQQPMPMHPGYPTNPYGYPGYAPSPYPMAGYPGGAPYPQAGYPGAPYPGAGYPQGYPPQQMPGQQPPGYPGAPGPYGAAPYGSQMRHLPTPPPPAPAAHHLAARSTRSARQWTSGSGSGPQPTVQRLSKHCRRCGAASAVAATNSWAGQPAPPAPASPRFGRRLPRTRLRQRVRPKISP